MHTENGPERREDRLNPSGFKNSIELENTGEMKFYCIAIDKKKEEQNASNKELHNQGT